MSERNKFTLICGPCSLESSQQIEQFFEHFSHLNYLRAGIFKMRTDPQSFQGLGLEGVKLIKQLKQKFPFKLVTEVTSRSTLEALSPITDIFQVGTRNMYNYELLRDLAKTDKTVILKRGFSATIDEWLKAARYIGDAQKVWLCERGIRTFETSYRNTLDLNAISYIKKHTNYKVLVDPSHGTGHHYMVQDLSLAALAVGADGLLIEAHPNPQQAKSDADQALTMDQLQELVDRLQSLAVHFNKEVEF